MPPNSQVSFDIGVSPWFYDPDIFTASHIISSVNSKVVSVVELSKKADGVLTLTLKSGDYKHGASTGITFYGQRFVVYVTGHQFLPMQEEYDGYPDYQLLILLLPTKRLTVGRINFVNQIRCRFLETSF